MIDYRFNNARGAVLCRNCRIIIDTCISYDDALAKWDGRDLCAVCKNMAQLEAIYCDVDNMITEDGDE